MPTRQSAYKLIESHRASPQIDPPDRIADDRGTIIRRVAGRAGGGQLYKPLAQSGKGAAQVKLGQLYLLSDFPPEPDYHQSLHWLEKANLQGRPNVEPLLQKVRRTAEIDEELAEVREQQRKTEQFRKDVERLYKLESGQR